MLQDAVYIIDCVMVISSYIINDHAGWMMGLYNVGIFPRRGSIHCTVTLVCYIISKLAGFKSRYTAYY